MELTQLRGIMTKLEYKAMRYFTGLQKNDIIYVIRMNEAGYFLISHKTGGGTFGSQYVYFTDIDDIIKNHSKSLLKRYS